MQTDSVAPNLTTPAMNRLMFDGPTYAAQLKQSVGPGQYVLSAYVAPHCEPCTQTDPEVSAGFGLGVGDCRETALVDVESDLQNIGRKWTRAPSGQYRGDGSAPATCASSRAPDCRGIATVNTRLANPPCTLRGTGWNRWEWLCQDPQQHATTVLPFFANENTSLVLKDNHRPVLAKPIAPTALPPGNRNLDASIGAPQWIPTCKEAAGPVGESPIMLWRSCSDVRAP